MKCPNCGTLNPDNAKFCRTCGISLDENDIGEDEVIHVPTVESDADYQKSNTNTPDNRVSSDWASCCICLAVIFIIFALFSIF